MPTFNYTVDGEPQSTNEHQLTAGEILSKAGKDPANFYLVLFKGNSQQEESFEGRPDAIIHMHQHMIFISISLAPTPVS